MLRHIELRNLLPDAFADAPTIPDTVNGSGIWSCVASFERGKRYLVSADSGRGKSSLCSYICGARTDFKGEILFDGINVASFDTAKWCSLRRESLAWLPQEMKLFPELTVMENIRVKNDLTKFKSDQWIRQALDRMEIAERADWPVGKISVGQQQRVALIRLLCQPCSFMLLDEPVSHLDRRRAVEAARMIDEEARSYGAGVIVTSVGIDLNIPDSILITL